MRAFQFNRDDGVWIVTHPDFPEVISFGKNIQIAKKYGLMAVSEALAARRAAVVKGLVGKPSSLATALGLPHISA